MVSGLKDRFRLQYYCTALFKLSAWADQIGHKNKTLSKVKSNRRTEKMNLPKRAEEQQPGEPQRRVQLDSCTHIFLMIFFL